MTALYWRPLLLVDAQVIRKLRELVSQRGKRGTDRVKVVEELQFLLSKATVRVRPLHSAACLCLREFIALFPIRR